VFKFPFALITFRLFTKELPWRRSHSSIKVQTNQYQR